MKFLSFILLLLTFCFLGYTLDDDAYLSIQKEKTNTYTQTPQFLLMPAESAFAESIQTKILSIPSNIGAELSASIPLPSGLGKNKDFQFAVYNALRTIRSLKGSKYYSSVTNKVDVLFTSAYTLNNIDDQKVIKDILLDQPPIPATSSILSVVRASDLSGRVLYRFTYEYKSQDDELLMTIANENTLFFVMFPLSTAGKNKLKVLLRFQEDSIDVYINNGLDNKLLSAEVIAPTDYVLEGFLYRLRAIFRWVEAQVNESVKGFQ